MTGPSPRCRSRRNLGKTDGSSDSSVWASGFSEHPNQDRSQRPVLLAVDKELGAAAARHDSGTTLKREAVAADAPCAPGKRSRPGATALPLIPCMGRAVPNVTTGSGRPRSRGTVCRQGARGRAGGFPASSLARTALAATNPTGRATRSSHACPSCRARPQPSQHVWRPAPRGSPASGRASW
jgi:hypothetical protein